MSRADTAALLAIGWEIRALRLQLASPAVPKTEDPVVEAAAKQADQYREMARREAERDEGRNSLFR